MSALRVDEVGGDHRLGCVVITPFAPISSLGGTPIRVLSTIEGLAEQLDVTVVCSARLSDDGRAEVRRICDELGVEVVFVGIGPHRSRPGSLGARLRALRGALSPVTEARSVDTAPGILEELVRDCDLLWVCRTSAFLDCRMPVPTGGAVVVDVDDLEERVIMRDRSVGAVRRTIRARKAAHVRHRLLSASGLALVCSDLDAARLDAPCPVRVLPNTYRSTGARANDGGEGGGTVVLVGTMGYGPNREGAEWLLREVWPRVHRRLPGADLVVAGSRSEHLSVPASAGNVTLLGQVDAIEPLLRSASVVAAPILVGSGTRVKILEGFAHCIPVVSTTAGAEGIDAVDGRSIVIADDPDAFGDAIVRLLTDPDAADRIARGGRRLFDERYSLVDFRRAVASIASDALDDAIGSTGRVRR